MKSLFLSCFLGLAFAAWGGDSPLPAGLPEPPRQHDTWKPPTSDLPTNLVSAAKILFDFGLADPRGCDYREIGFGTNGLRFHAWVLPARRDEPQRFAVCWNGLVYPVTGVGAKADLKRDVQVLIRAQEIWHRHALTNAWYGLDEFWTTSEYDSISQTNLTAVKALLLLRLGQSRPAQEYWNGWSMILKGYQSGEDAADPYRQLASVWAESLFKRAVFCHIRGDDALSLADCQRLTQARPGLERTAEQRGFSRPNYPYSVPNGSSAPKMSYFTFLDPLPVLLADEQRRVNEPPHQMVLQPGLDKFPDKSQRIAALIADLGGIVARQHTIPGWAELNYEPTVKALIAEGDTAVDPLLDCMENDRRLTRSVSFTHDFSSIGDLVTVQDAARAALREILMVNFKTAAEYRGYWEKYKSNPRPERWYATLLDDSAGREQWMQAAGNILSRTDGKVVYLWKNAPIPDGTNGYAYVAESLRSKTGPAIAGLFLRRALEIAPTNYASSLDCWSFQDAADLGLMLAEWDPPDGREVLLKILPRCPALYADPRTSWSSGCAVVSQRFAALVIALARLGDTSGLDLYAGWLGRQKVEDLADAMPEVLTPLGRFPDHPTIKEVSANFFQKQKIDWMGEWRGNDFLHTHLVQNAAFRRLILEALADKSKAGTFELLPDGQYSITTPYDGRGGAFESDALAPKAGEPVTFRVCDDVASRLSRIENLPALKLYWPEPMRDATVAAIVQFLNQNGDRLQLKSAIWPVDED